MASEDEILIKEYNLFNLGRLFRSYLNFGAHVVEMNQSQGVLFTVWAPHVKSVCVVGSFNHWRGSGHMMDKQGTTGVWSLFIEGLGTGAIYKYEIETLDGQRFLKTDPFSFLMERRPLTASIVYELNGYLWNDEVWQSKQVSQGLRAAPLLIYEVHPGSWKRNSSGEFLTYRELADELVLYVKNMGFTHLELMPIMEHPFDGSWGYQIAGYYAATSRYGTPHDLMYLIDCCHRNGIGVILDWVPGHFCKDAHGLASFDGTALYEAEEHIEWGTYKFNFFRTEVWSFLISNALFWLDYFHVDGLRVDGVTSMLLLNYGSSGNQIRKNSRGGYENEEAREFLRTLNTVVFNYYPSVLMIAEESTDWPMVTRPSYDGGLGFNFKWNMGWMNDILEYIKTPFHRRGDAHHLLTFSLMYAFSENFILPFSHDEVVHGKCSLLNRMPGDYWQKFAGLRLLYFYLICHPGKKLLFMGGEFGQFIEWRDYAGLDWFLLDFPSHNRHLHYVREANLFYREEACLWQLDHEWDGFEWIDADNRKQSVLSFIRKGSREGDFVVVILNFQPSVYDGYRVGVPSPGVYKEVFNTDCQEYGGAGNVNAADLTASQVLWHGREYSILCKIPPLAGVIFKLLSS